MEGINTYVPKPITSNSKAQGRYSKLDFVYIARDNTYRCPAGQSLGYSHSTIEDGMNIHVYIASSCKTCPQKSQCTTGKERRVRRWEHEGVLDTMQTRIDNNRDKMKLRRCTVEHVFGTVKSCMGSVHFTMKGLAHVSTEISLHILAYNMRRVMAILGIADMMKAIRLVGA